VELQTRCKSGGAGQVGRQLCVYQALIYVYMRTDAAIYPGAALFYYVAEVVSYACISSVFILVYI
jgi:hypothetical protein